MEGFSKYFTFEELTDSEGHPELVAQNRIDAKRYALAGKRLSKLLESIRDILGDKPIKINSGYRSKALNTEIYKQIFLNRGFSLDKAIAKAKAKNSNHNLFEAADIKPSSISIQDAFEALIKAHKDGLLPDLRKVLQEGSWLHVEVSMSAGDYRGFFVSNDNNVTWEKIA